jgi:hypothetical protein
MMRTPFATSGHLHGDELVGDATFGDVRVRSTLVRH